MTISDTKATVNFLGNQVKFYSKTFFNWTTNTKFPVLVTDIVDTQYKKGEPKLSNDLFNKRVNEKVYSPALLYDAYKDSDFTVNAIYYDI